MRSWAGGTTASVSAADSTLAGHVSVDLIGRFLREVVHEPALDGGSAAGECGSEPAGGEEWRRSPDRGCGRHPISPTPLHSLGGTACARVDVATIAATSDLDPVLTEEDSHGYLMEVVNSCGSTP